MLPRCEEISARVHLVSAHFLAAGNLTERCRGHGWPVRVLKMSVVKKQHIANNVLRRGNPYAVNLKADHERCLEEARVRQQMEERQRKQEEKMRERIRRQIVQAAMEESQELPEPLEVVAALEDEKRVRAWSGLLKVDDRYHAARSDLRRRFYEPTLEEQDRRDVAYMQRKAFHGMERDARRSELDAVDKARSALLLVASEKKLQEVEHRRSQVQLLKAQSAVALHGARVASQVSVHATPAPIPRNIPLY